MRTDDCFCVPDGLNVHAWLRKEGLEVQPGELSQFAPNGNGVYGYQAKCGVDPFKAAPTQEPAGGAIYFDSRFSPDDFRGLLRLAEVRLDDKDYSVFFREAEQPGEEGYIVQMRLVSRFGLRYMFDAITEGEYDQFPLQGLTVSEALSAFTDEESKRWGTSFGAPGLDGLFGGDGHFAQEKLAFGFMVENSYFHIYRIWSRAWLVTK